MIRKLVLLVIFILVLASQSSGATLIGTAKVDVTPQHPVVLAGYGGRTMEYEGVDAKLWARALVIGDKTPVAIVVLDNCGVPGSLTMQLAKRLAEYGISRDRLVVAATHTHNAPTLVGYATVVWAGRTTPEQAKRVEAYTQFAVEKMEQAVVDALAAREPMHLEWAQGRVTFGGNRRVLADGKWAGFGFQRGGPVDHSLPILAARDRAGKVRAVWANYACHCTTVGSRNRVGGDWAGFANSSIEKEFPHAVSLMTIGCGADVGPQPSGSLEVAAGHGRAVAKEAKRLLTGRTTRLDGEPQVVSRRIKLPLAEPPPRTYWDEQLRGRGFHHELAKIMMARLENKGSIAREVDYPLSVWKFGEDLVMVFLAGEVVVDYSVRLNRQLDWSRLWITAWANDMPGYIPSRRVLAEGGYEAEFSQVYYAQPCRYAPQVEDVLVGAVKKLVGPDFASKPNQEPAPFHKIPSGEKQTFERLAKWAASPKTGEEAAILNSVRRLAKQASPAVGRVTRNDGEETEWFNFAGDFTRRVFIRQQTKGVELQWQTPPVDKEAERLTLCFNGGIGWQSQPQTDGFALLVAGEQVLTFDVTGKPTRWKSRDETIELIYLPTWTSDEDSAGFFFLSLSAANASEDRVVPIAVRSLGKDSRRWFAIDSKQEVRKKLNLLAMALGA